MILSCPACDTKYVVKDGAIPPGGRQVRCAACKNAWHQDPEPVEGDGGMTSSAADVAAPAVEDPAPPRDDVAEVPPLAERDDMISDYAEPEVDTDEANEYPARPPASFASLTASLGGGAASGLTAPSIGGKVDALSAARAGQTAPAEPEAAAPVEPDEPVAEFVAPVAAEDSWDDQDHFISSIDDERRSGRGLRIALFLLVVIAAAAAALWFFAPASLKERIGLADASATPLEVMLTNSDRQKLASGNELLAISGRVINPTGAEQTIPPIRASLRNHGTRKLVYQWTIAPPARSLPPHGSASFNSAEVDVPTGGDELTVTLGGAAA